MPRFLLITLLISTFASGAYAASEQETSVGVEALAEPVRAYFKGQCEFQRQVAVLANKPDSIAAARRGVALSCDCLPGEVALAIDKLKQDPAAQSLTKAQFMAAMATPMNTCAARQARQMITDECRKDSGAKLSQRQRESYCSCMESGLGKLSDDQIANDSLIANQRFQAKVKARMNGQESPKFEPTVTEGVDVSCKASAVQ